MIKTSLIAEKTDLDQKCVVLLKEIQDAAVDSQETEILRVQYDLMRELSAILDIRINAK